MTGLPVSNASVYEGPSAVASAPPGVLAIVPLWVGDPAEGDEAVRPLRDIADLAGVSRFQYPPHLRVIRLMCSGRVDLSFIFRTLAKKADGVFIGGCHLNDCHYNPEGNYDALGNTLMAKRILEKIGVKVDIQTVDASEFGESTYDNALPWTRIAAVPHVRYGNFGPMLPQLDALHGARVAKDKEFQWWSQDVAEFRIEHAKKYVSLNESERRVERDRQAAKEVTRQAQRKARWPTMRPTTACRSASATSSPRPLAKRPPKSAPTRCCASRRPSSPTPPTCWCRTRS